MPGAAKTTNGAPGVRSRQAESASSGPIPAGSPMVIASGAVSPVMRGARGPFRPTGQRSKADVRPYIAQRAQLELNHQHLVAHRGVQNGGTAGERFEDRGLGDIGGVRYIERRARVFVAETERIAGRKENRRRLSQ